jgi:hypothetical protein
MENTEARDKFRNLFEYTYRMTIEAAAAHPQ